MTNADVSAPPIPSLLDPHVQSDPRPLYALLHEHAPVHRMPETGMYVVSRYDDVRAVLLDHGSFSNDVVSGGSLNADVYHIHETALAERGWHHVQTLQRTDPPIHGRYRRLLDQVFNAANVRALTPHITQIANELIDDFGPKGECEFVDAFALRLPGIVIAEQIGLNRDDIPTFKHWADSILAPAMVKLDADGMAAMAEVELEMQHFFDDMFRRRREAPASDLVTALVNAQVEGDAPLTPHELQNLMHQLISGGYDTVISALANGLWLLLRHPEQMTKLRENPALLKGFVDEVLRYESPVQGLLRRATRDVELAGTTIPEGAIVIVRYGAANHDPAKFACPHLFDIERKNAASHLAFGNGAHFCVGRLLARQELMIGFEVLLERLTDIELARPLPDPPHHTNLLLHGMRELPIRFTLR